MKDSFNWKRIGLLLRYDYLSFRKTILLMLGVMASIFVGIIVYNIVFQEWGDLQFEDYLHRASNVWMPCFLFSNLAVLFTMTKLLHRKINQRINSVPFVMLPASEIEKNCEIHISYFLAYVANFLVFLFLGFLFILIPYWTSGTTSEAWSVVLSEGWEPIFLAGLGLIVSGLFLYILYLNLNMLFKKHPQPKSIGVMTLLWTGYVWYIIKLGMNGFLGSKVAHPIDSKTAFFGIAYWAILLLLIPTMALFFNFYIQITEKQVK